jgi:hypothetical protein
LTRGVYAQPPQRVTVANYLQDLSAGGTIALAGKGWLMESARHTHDFDQTQEVGAAAC